MSAQSRNFLFIVHELSRSGAPIVCLSLIRWLTKRGHRCSVLGLADGELAADFRAVAEVWDIPRYLQNRVMFPRWLRWFFPRVRGRLKNTLRRILLRRSVQEPAKHPEQFDLIVYNSLCALPALSVLKQFKAPVVMWLHELSSNAGLSSMTKLMEEKKDTSFIAVAHCVASSIGEGYDLMDRMTVIPPFIERPVQSSSKEEACKELCQALGLPDDAWIIGVVGWVQWRKGADMFVRLAHHLPASIDGKPVHLVWIGGELERGLTQRLQRQAPNGNRVHFYGHHAQPQYLMPAFDVFVLPSREDPFPIVMLEAALAGCPIVAFKGSGGAEEFITDDIGITVPFADVPAMADAVEMLLTHPERLEHMSAAAKRTVEQGYLAEQRCPEMERALLAVLEP